VNGDTHSRRNLNHFPPRGAKGGSHKKLTKVPGVMERGIRPFLLKLGGAEKRGTKNQAGRKRTGTIGGPKGKVEKQVRLGGPRQKSKKIGPKQTHSLGESVFYAKTGKVAGAKKLHKREK